MYVFFDKLNPRTERLVIGVNIYQARFPFSKVKNAFVRVLDRRTGELLVRYDLSNNFGQTYTVHVGELVKDENGNWIFIAVGEATKDKSIKQFENNLIKGTLNVVSNPSEQPPKKKKRFFGLF